jgi:RHS repeat-associated protein
MLTTTKQQIETGTGEGGELLGINFCFAVENHGNQQYSVTAITNSSAGVVERYAYQAYGEPTILDASASVLSSSSIDNRYTYTGREWDGTVGLYHFRARWMSGLTGRFLTRDPIGYSGSMYGLNEYCEGNPQSRVDPKGLDAAAERECNSRIAQVEYDMFLDCKGKRTSYKLKCSTSCKDPGERGYTTCKNEGDFTVTICTNNLRGSDAVVNTIIHELTHVHDMCHCGDKNKCRLSEIDPSAPDFCKVRLCMEVRAFLNEGACDDKTTDEERKSCVRDKIDPYVSDWGCSATDVWEAIDRCYVPAGQSLPVFPYY